jgi:uncharacterized membrane protein (DUF2068 family)
LRRQELIRVGGDNVESRSNAGGQAERDDSRLLPFLAAERALRAVLLVAAGIALLTHAHTDWATAGRHAAARFGLDPSGNTTGRVINRLGSLGVAQTVRYGVIALLYGVLEGVEGYGLFRRRAWAEYLTLASTAVLLVPEIYELIKRPSALKALGFAVNLLIVAYLALRLRKHRAETHDAPESGSLVRRPVGRT